MKAIKVDVSTGETYVVNEDWEDDYVEPVQGPTLQERLEATEQALLAMMEAMS